MISVLYWDVLRALLLLDGIEEGILVRMVLPPIMQRVPFFPGTRLLFVVVPGWR